MQRSHEPAYVDPSDLVMQLARKDQALIEAKQKAEYWQEGCEAIQAEFDDLVAENRRLQDEVVQLSLQLARELLRREAA